MNTPQTPPLSDQLRELRDTGKLTVHPEVISIDRASPGELVVKSTDARISARLRSLNVFFLELRRKVRILTKDDTWSIRYASQVQPVLLPMLHSSQTLRILIDPMGPYRDPVNWLAEGNELSLFELPSHAYYFLSREELVNTPGTSTRLTNRLQRTNRVWGDPVKKIEGEPT